MSPRIHFDTLPVVTYPAAVSAQDVELLAHADLWLKLSGLQPDPGLRDAVLVRAHELIGRALLTELTPDIASMRSLAAFLGQRSHARLSQHRRKSARPAVPTSPESTTEEPDDSADQTV